MIRYLSGSDVARILGVRPSAVANWRTRSSGPLPPPAATVNGSALWTPAQIREALDERYARVDNARRVRERFMTNTVYVCSLPICGHVAESIPAIQLHLAEEHEGAARYLTQPADIENCTVRLSYSTHEWTVVRESNYKPESVLIARKTPGGQMRETRWVARADLEFARPSIVSPRAVAPCFAFEGYEVHLRDLTSNQTLCGKRAMPALPGRRRVSCQPCRERKPAVMGGIA